MEQPGLRAMCCSPPTRRRRRRGRGGSRPQYGAASQLVPLSIHRCSTTNVTRCLAAPPELSPLSYRIGRPELRSNETRSPRFVYVTTPPLSLSSPTGHPSPCHSRSSDWLPGTASGFCSGGIPQTSRGARTAHDGRRMHQASARRERRRPHRRGASASSSHGCRTRGGTRSCPTVPDDRHSSHPHVPKTKP